MVVYMVCIYIYINHIYYEIVIYVSVFTGTFKNTDGQSRLRSADLNIEILTGTGRVVMFPTCVWSLTALAEESLAQYPISKFKSPEETLSSSLGLSTNSYTSNPKKGICQVQLQAAVPLVLSCFILNSGVIFHQIVPN